MDRRAFIAGSGALFAAPLAAWAQHGAKLPRIGLLANNQSPHLVAFEQGLSELGYIEGRSILVERRIADGQSHRLPALAAQLVGFPVDLIVAPDPPSTLAAKGATKTIPVVMRSSDDPVQAGLVASLAKPGGNITGVYSLLAELEPKRLELLKEAVPSMRRVGALWNPGFAANQVRWKRLESAARQLGLSLESVEASSLAGLDAAFRGAVSARVDALITLRNPVVVVHQRRVVELAARSRLPVIYDEREFVEAGGLMAYGAKLDDLYRRTATYVDKILKGAKPGDIPVEQATKFELAINLKTAKALGLTIPQSLLLRADQVIE